MTAAELQFECLSCGSETPRGDRHEAGMKVVEDGSSGCAVVAGTGADAGRSFSLGFGSALASFQVKLLPNPANQPHADPEFKLDLGVIQVGSAFQYFSRLRITAKSSLPKPVSQIDGFNLRDFLFRCHLGRKGRPDRRELSPRCLQPMSAYHVIWRRFPQV